MNDKPTEGEAQKGTGAQDEFLPTLRRETLRMARFRARLVAAVFTAALPVSIGLSYYASQTTGPAFTLFPTVSIASMILAVIGVEAYLSRRHSRALAEGVIPSRFAAHASGLAEMTVPTLVMMAIYQGVGDPLLALGSAGPWVYFPFIVLSTLYLDLRIAVASGVFAGVQYLAVALVFAGVAQDAAGGLAFSQHEVVPFFHYQKFLLLVITGVIAGFVAREMKRGLARSFQETKERQRVLSVFGQLTAPEVVDELLSEGGAVATERKHVCVMFLDVRGYSTLSETAGPEEVVDYLNRLFDYTIGIIHRRGGIVHQLLGDGLMATFGAPVSRGDDAGGALRAATEIVDGLDALVAREGLWDTRLGVGLHYGEAVAGLVGSSIHKEYKVTGDVVNVAARIEQLCKTHGAQVLCSEAVLDGAQDRPDGASPDAIEDLGEVVLRGRERPVRLFKVR